MAHYRVHAAFALAETGGNDNNFEIDVKANYSADRADFCVFYRAAGIDIESARAQREKTKMR